MPEPLAAVFVSGATCPCVSAEVELKSVAAAEGWKLGWESARHKPSPEAGEIVNSNVLAEMVQRVCLNDENIATVVGETADRIDEIMRS